MSASPIQQNPSYLSAIQVLQNNQPEHAKQLLLALLNDYEDDVSVWLGLAVACNKLSDSQGCFDALDNALKIEPNNITILIMKGDLLLAQGKKRLANHCYGVVVSIAENSQDLPDDLIQAVNRVIKARDQINGEIEQHLRKNLTLDEHPNKRTRRFRQSLDLLSGSKSIYPQKPRAFYFPELPLKQFYDREEFDWAKHVEKQTGAISEELAGLIAKNVEFEPYIKSAEQGPSGHVNPLLDKTDWSAFFLIKDGVVVQENANLCPKTMNALSKVPFPKIKGRAPMVLFSLLKPGTRIAPHHGFLNTRLICHLPLVVPDNCGLRVGNQEHQWRKGEIVVFDDSIEHEAWNNSQENRIILIFDIWRPELTELERKWVSELLEAVDTFDEI